MLEEPHKMLVMGMEGRSPRLFFPYFRAALCHEHKVNRKEEGVNPSRLHCTLSQSSV